MDWTKTKKRPILYEGGAMLIWQYPVVEEENDKIYEDEEAIIKWKHIEINDEKGKDEIDN